MRNYCIALLLFFVSAYSYSQDLARRTATFGRITQEGYTLDACPFDENATAVVLFEKGENTFEVIGDYIYLVKTIHRRIKVFDAAQFDGGSIAISYYTPKDKRGERIKDLKALTHNGVLKQFVAEEAFFTSTLSEKWSQKRFAFPDIKDGSIIEYTYRLETPYFFNFGNWEFQTNLPKMYSEFKADIPGNYIYRRSLLGTQKLDINTAEIKKKCLEIQGYSKAADCESTVYAMFNVPAYKEEALMLSPLNYISRLDYELETVTNFKGELTKYTKSWDDVDREFKRDKDIGRQLKKVSFFEDVLPDAIKMISNDRARAEEVYKFVRDHYTWNGEYRIFSEIRVKNAFKSKVGNIAEINLSLINALNAVNIKAELALSSTRKNGLPSLNAPVLSDFNYVLAYVVLDGKKILLDASSKWLSFGMVDFSALNKRARVMDFEDPSFWVPIEPEIRNFQYIDSKVAIDKEGDLSGTISETYSGYCARALRRRASDEGRDYFDNRLMDHEDMVVQDLEIEAFDSVEQPLKISHTLNGGAERIGTSVIINPFVLNVEFMKNPFSSEKREFPVDLGYTSATTYQFKLDLGEHYVVEYLPKNQVLKMPDENGECLVAFSQTKNELSCTFRFRFKKVYYLVDEYATLKEFFSKATDFNTKSSIKLKRI